MEQHTNIFDEKKDIGEQQKLLEEKEYANAYAEVLEVLKYVEEDAVAQIPHIMIEMFKRKANPDYIFDIDPNIPFDKQPLSEKTKAIFAIIYRDYWATDKQREKILEHEECERMKYRVDLFNEVMKSEFDLNEESIVELLKKSNNSMIFNELNLVLLNIPAAIVSCIPTKVLLSIVNKKADFYEKEFSISGGNNYYPETISIIKYLVKQYVPDSLIKEVNESVPENFDLSIIFDNEEDED